MVPRAVVVALAIAGCGRLDFEPIADPVRLVIGNDHTCLLADGALRCWGQNDHHQIRPIDGDALVPTAIASDHAWIDVALGQNHTCALDDAGHAWCWGDNMYGGLGLGDIGTDRAVPTMLPEDRTYRRIFAGSFTTCAIATDDSLWCWGYNLEGMLGVGDEVDRASPTRVGTARWTTIGIAIQHACGVQLDGSLWCWGGNAFGALGTGEAETVTHAEPVMVAGASRIARLEAGAYFACTLSDAGTLACWGDGGDDNLGLGDTADHDRPIAIDATRWTSFTTGHHHACGLHGDAASCWGQNFEGQVGVGATSARQPTPAPVAGSWHAIAAGDSFTCGLDLDDAVWCWGRNITGQLGTGDAVEHDAPVRTN